MKTCNPSSIPLKLGKKWSKDDCPQTNEELIEKKPIPYKILLDSLMHASISTKHDTCYFPNSLAQYLSNLGKKKGMKHLGLLCKGSFEHFFLKGYCDAHWAPNIDNQRSTSHFCFLLGDCIVSWTSEKQRSTALSSTKSEYMAISRATTDAT